MLNTWERWRPRYRKTKIVVAYHGVNIEKFAYAQPADSPGVIPTILTAARLVEKKGLDDLLRACALLRGKGVSFRCIVIGEGPSVGGSSCSGAPSA